MFSTKNMVVPTKFAGSAGVTQNMTNMWVLCEFYAGHLTEFKMVR